VSSTASPPARRRSDKAAATRSHYYAFSSTAQEVAHFLRSIGIGANEQTVSLLATLDRRFPGLSLHDLHEATVLIEALTLKTQGTA
jgi:hypothetical protein